MTPNQHSEFGAGRAAQPRDLPARLEYLRDPEVRLELGDAAWTAQRAALVDELVAQYEDQLEALRNALIGMRELASVSYNGDPWYAENDGLNAADVFDRAREALGESSPASEPERP